MEICSIDPSDQKDQRNERAYHDDVCQRLVQGVKRVDGRQDLRSNSEECLSRSLH